MTNERLRSAIHALGLSAGGLAESVRVDVKTVERWIALDRVPHRRHRHDVAALLKADEAHLWPSILEGSATKAASMAEIVAVYPNRGDVPQDLWEGLFAGAHQHIDLLAYAALFLTDWDPDLGAELAARAGDGVDVRILLGDPDSVDVLSRGASEGIGPSISARIRISVANLAAAVQAPRVQLRFHSTPLYNSMYPFDGDMLVNMHSYGHPAAMSPVMHLRRLADGRLFDHYLTSLEKVWETATDQVEGVL